MNRYLERAMARWDKTIEELASSTVTEAEAAMKRVNGDHSFQVRSDAYIIDNAPRLIGEAEDLHAAIVKYGDEIRFAELPCLRKEGKFIKIREKMEELDRIGLYCESVGILLDRLGVRYDAAKQRSPNVRIVDFKQKRA